jgi:tripartite-type tricarboxylate transporter receptor subunit TctC
LRVRYAGDARRTMKHSLLTRLLCGAAFAASLSSITYANNAGYTPGTITFIVPATPGGTTDLVARLAAKELSQAWNQPVLVENRAGAGGTIGASYVIKSKADGLTVLVAPSALGVRSGLDTKLSYDAVRDLKGIAQLATTPSFLVVSPSLQVETPEQLAQQIKQSGKNSVIYGSAGVGSTGHMHAALFANKIGVNGEHAAYKGTPEAVNDAITGRIGYVFSPGPNALPYATEGRAKILATTSETGRRIASKAGVSPMVLADEIGDDWYAAFVPANTPLALRQQLSAALGKILASDDIKRRFEAIGAEPSYIPAEELDVMFSGYVKKARDLGQQIGITLD